MTPLVRRFIKTAILFLAVGLAIGGWMIVEREIGGRFPAPHVASAHTHAILVGFVMMMILGVALWMFPRAAKGDTRYDPRLAEMAYWLLAAGTVTRVIGELLRAGAATPALRWTIVVAGFMQIAGLLAFFSTMWVRVRGVGAQARDERVPLSTPPA